MTLLSIIIPHRDRTRLLDELLAGFPDRDDLEIIVIDDRSLTPPRLEGRFEKSNLIMLSNTPDTPGAGGARNLGLEHAKGKWVAFCDSDDRVCSKSLERIMTTLDKETCEVVFCKPSSFKADDSIGTRHLRAARIHDAIKRGETTGVLAEFTPPWSKIISKKLIDQHNLRFSLARVSEDVLFNTRLAVLRPSVFLSPHVFYHVRQGNPSLTSIHDTQHLKTRIDEMCISNAILRENGLGRYQAAAGPYLSKLFVQDKVLARKTLFKMWKDGGNLLPRNPKRWMEKIGSALSRKTDRTDKV